MIGNPRPDLPSKKTYRTSVTHKLRSEIRAEAANYGGGGRFLELGCDQGFTTLSVCDAYDEVTAVDISLPRIQACNRNRDSVFSTHAVGNNITFVCGTSESIPGDHWDVVLIDALHTWDGVKKDFKQVLMKNSAERYTVFFHDYWRLDFGVNKYIKTVFREGEYHFAGEPATWQPDQKIKQIREGHEAVVIRLDRDLIQKIVKRLP